jgi:hypothetical protein
MTLQVTRYARFQRRVGTHLSQALVGSWRRRSVGLLSLLFGFIVGSNVTMYWFQKSGQQRPFAVLMVVLVRIDQWPLSWLALDNLRIGTVYAVVFEAFKLGS